MVLPNPSTEGSYLLSDLDATPGGDSKSADNRAIPVVPHTERRKQEDLDLSAA